MSVCVRFRVPREVEPVRFDKGCATAVDLMLAQGEPLPSLDLLMITQTEARDLCTVARSPATSASTCSPLPSGLRHLRQPCCLCRAMGGAGAWEVPARGDGLSGPVKAGLFET